MELENVKDPVIYKSLLKTNAVLNRHNKIMCSISGGSDSDIILDIISKYNDQSKIEYVWFDTGLEYQATKDHLIYLENRHNIKIRRLKAKKSIPQSCKEKGQPFMNKYASEMIYRLQLNNFNWKDDAFEKLYKKYPNCKIALNWWCNNSGEGSSFNISRNKYLKEYMIDNPPKFKISGKCCDYAKKDISKELVKKEGFDLIVMGIRKSEGGARSTAYKSCYEIGKNKYMPIFWYTDEIKRKYEKLFDIKHSKCYTEYGLERTGCAGCPFSKRYTNELFVLDVYEPKLFKGVKNIFKDSYEYTRNYLIYRVTKYKEKDPQMSLF